ncbi:MAG: imidazolonepropionase [Betaproteobacteria bacterium]|nr:imidazolonepropionase [Betaproteobacteria bacterium]
MRFDALYRHARIATLQGEGAGFIEDGSLALQGGKIAWLGPDRDLPPAATSEIEHNCRGALLTPGLIDCHTHLVFAGNRANEFEQRLRGASYEDIARAGGGIVSTVRATRAASEEELYVSAAERVAALMAEGVTTVEIKSGYGLDVATEKKILQVARRLGASLPVAVRTTFLGAHAVPPEYAGRADQYIDFVCEKILPAVAKLSDAVDAYCDNVGFSREQTERVFQAAEAHSLPLKLHAEQFSNQRGAELAADYRALSADHLEYLDEAGVKRMAEMGTVAVLLPGAFHFLREKQLPPINLLRRHQVPIAVASDLNPGSSPIVSLLANMHLACTLFRLTPLEVLRGVTVNAARALGLADRGEIAAGKRADFCLWRAESPAELCYWLGGLRPTLTVFGGAVRHA